MSRSTTKPHKSLTEGRRETVDVTAVLTLWLVLLYGLSAGAVLPGFGAIGQPATLVALGATLWWWTARMVPSLGLDRSFQPVRIALAVYLAYVIASYGSAGLRVLTDLERSNSTRALIATVAAVGIAALAADGIASIDRLRTLLRRLTTFGALFAAFGIVQAIAGEAFTLVPPGLVWNSGEVGHLSTRGGQRRPFATGQHPIEYAVMVAALFPLALHWCFHPRSPGDRTRAVLEAAVLLLAVPLSLSRTSVVSLAAAGMVLAIGWSWRRRINALGVALLAIPLVATLVPGAYRVMLELFAGSSEDPSVQLRLSRIPNIMALVRERPWFGMGHGTFTSTDYFLIDNQLWVTAITDGLVGVTLTLALFLAAGLVAVWSRLRPLATTETTDLGRAIAASIAGMVVSLATFDAFFYRILTMTLFLMLGCAGALWRLSGDVEGSSETSQPPATFSRQPEDRDR